VVFRVQPGVNLAAGDPNHDLLQEALALAVRWPGLTFVHDAPEAAYIGHEARLIGDGTGLIARLTLNLPRLALRARREGLAMGALLDEALEAAADQLKHRAEALSKRPAGDFPLLMGQGLLRGAEALEAADPIADAIRQGQLAIGFVGLAEALVVLSGAHHGNSESAHGEALALIELLAARCATLSEQHDIQIVLQDGEADEVAMRFARQDRRRFGMIRGVTETVAYSDGAGVPAEAALSLGDRLALEGAYVRHLTGGVVFRWRTPEAPTAAALLEAVQQAIACGHRAFAWDYPAGYSESPGSTQRTLVRRRGYLAIEG
jgi:ribonucleoside-triphosphate reductase